MDLKERREINTLKRHPWELSRADVLFDMLQTHLKQKCNILDIGCGDLFLEEYLLDKNKSLNFYCVDIAYSAEEVALLNQKNPNIKIYNNLDDLEIQPVEMDIVLLLDVIEHIEDDKQFLASVVDRKIFTDNTKLIITVPAFQSLYSLHDHFLGHFRRYNNKRLINLITLEKLEKMETGYFYFGLLLPRLLQQMMEKISVTKKETTGLVEWKGGKRLSKFLRWGLNADYAIFKMFNKLRIKIPGLSTYVICQKRV